VSHDTPDSERQSWTVGQYSRAGLAEQILATLVAWSARQAAEAAQPDKARWQALAARYSQELQDFRATDDREADRIIREHGPTARAVVEGGR
jgi:hypothetical protein